MRPETARRHRVRTAQNSLDRLWLRASSLQARITAIAMLPAIALAALVGGLSISLRANDLDTGLQQRGLLLARQLASAADYGVFSGNTAALQALVESVGEERATLAVEIRDRDDRTLASVGEIPRGAELPRGATENVSARPSGILEREGWLMFREPIRSPRLPIDDLDPSGGTVPGTLPGRSAGDARESLTGTAIVVLSTDEIHSDARRFAAAVIGILGLVLLVTGLFARRMSRRLSSPVVAIADAVERIGTGETGVRVAPIRIQLLDHLGSGVNEMAARLEQSMQQLEQRVAEATRQLLEKKEEAEDANRAKSKFLAAASHDLRQPMHALGMFVAALAQHASTPVQRRLISQVDRAVGAMGDLLDSLLDISRLDAGAVETRVGMLPLRPVLERIGNEFAAVARGKGLDLVVRPTNLWVRSDRILLERILVNLLSNAVRYTEHGGILLAARVCGAARDEVRIDVRDSGPGIAEEAREAIFQEFVQLGNPERDRGKGLGLGLAIVRRLTTLLDHRLVLRTAVGRGSTFTLIVPRVPEQEAARAEAAAARFAAAAQARPPDRAPVRPSRRPPAPTAAGAIPPPAAADANSADATQAAIEGAMRPLAGQRILIIDDDPLVRESLAAILKGWGALVAENPGEPSLPAKLRGAERPDLILCDLRLRQELDGVQLLAAIRAELGGPLPAVLITGDTDPERTAMATESGDPVLHKPVRPAQLRALIRSLLRKAGTAD